MNTKTIDELIAMQFDEQDTLWIKNKLKNLVIIASEQAYWHGRKDMTISYNTPVFRDYLETINQ